MSFSVDCKDPSNRKTDGAEYDGDNIFAQILERRAPCHKIFESKGSLAFLDPFPCTEGHVIIIAKQGGTATSILGMPPPRASDFLYDVMRVANAVKAAVNADGVNLVCDSGAAAGQVVFHPHFQIIPRKANVALGSAAQLNDEDAARLLAMLAAALNPPVPLKKATFTKLSLVKPDARGLNLRVKVTKAPEKLEGVRGQNFWECTAGDASATCIFSFTEDQSASVVLGSVYEMRNAAVKMVRGSIRVTIDKWGKIVPAEGEIEVNDAADKNISNIEYEMVPNR
eukprot:NODE_10638_length_1338_cov_4.869529.p1 GENE.NODE_10638_length_1338_cov_4.869529~~NODE_10638_length_1338_cov_4.869529.p1  ORF type:complete len:283 (-),score=85.27 NODE_10638_length_1338_cov_4.869529:353-1201(-)